MGAVPPSDLPSLTAKSLREELRKKGLSTNGNKAVLLKRLEKVLAAEEQAEDIDVRCSMSNVSLVSSAATSSQRAQETLKRVELAAKIALLEEKERLLREEMELKMKRERLQLREEIALAEAREKALELNVSVSNQETIPRQGSNKETRRQGSTANGDDDSHRETTAIQALLTQQRRNLLPQSQIQLFRGDPLEYKGFVRAFESRIAKRTEDCAERLHFLDQYTDGKPNTIVRSYMHIDPAKGYAEARKALDRKYGDDYKISKAYVETLLTWPAIRATDIDGLEDFAIKLRGCLNAMEDISSLSEVNHPKNLQRIVGKLPAALQEGWRRLAFSLTRQDAKPSFQDVVKFVEKEVEVAADPVFGTAEMAAISSATKPSSVNKREEAVKVKKSKIHVTKATEDAANGELCPCCKAGHDLEACQKMLNKTSSERLEFVKKSGLCFGCLRHGHSSRQCRKRKTCSTCGARHPTLLHMDPRHAERGRPGPLPEPRNEVCGGTKIDRAGPVMSILPVLVTGRNGKTSKTYAFLDSGSSATFITNALAEKLKLKGEETSLTITTVEQDELKINSQAVIGLQASSLDGSGSVKLPCAFTLKKIPVTSSDIPDASVVQQWPHLAGIKIPVVEAEDVGLLIGCNCPLAMEPWDVVHSEDGGPYAIKTRLGWTIVGPSDQRIDITSSSSVKLNRVGASAKEDIAKMLTDMYNSDFTEKIGREPSLSVEDKLWQKQVNDSINLRDGKYEIALPLKYEDEEIRNLPNNRKMAERRAEGLKKKLERDEGLHQRYTECVEELIREGHAEVVPPDQLHRLNKTWYLPHHAVSHPAKPEKTRVVFDCSAKYGGVSLNDQLLQGPDLTNSLLGVLIRFRQEEVGFAADIKGMFHMVRVPEKDSDLLRFLWWPKGDTSQEPQDYRMRVHLFGAKSSPACSNFALKKTAEDIGTEDHSEVKNTIERNFYVDDCLKSVPDVDSAVKLTASLRSACQKGGFHLTKFISNDKSVMEHIPEEDRAVEEASKSLLETKSAEKRVLGILWNVSSDTIGVQVQVMRKPATRRGLLSATSSLFDPLGFVAPVLMAPKILLQQLCQLDLGWDDPIPQHLEQKWIEWTQSLHHLQDFKIRRCYKPPGFKAIASCQAHYFADASETGYGAVAYLRMTDIEGKTHCSFLAGKARVAPLKTVTIPRLELTAATVAVRLDAQLKMELEVTVDSTTFWTDSSTVLRYIKNRTSRFHTYVANRVQIIQQHSDPSQWRFVDGKSNPADEASRGISVEKFLHRSRWTSAPEFLWKNDDHWPVDLNLPAQLDQNDAEVKRPAIVSVTSTSEESPTDILLLQYSSWYRLKRAVAFFLRLRRFLKAKAELARSARLTKTAVQGSSISNAPSSTVSKKKRPNKKGRAAHEDQPATPALLSLEEIVDAETAVIRYVQSQSYKEEIIRLRGMQNVKRSCPISRLDPVLDQNVLRVGGRLGRSTQAFESKHPAIMPAKSHVTDLIIRDVHQSVGHQGRQHVLASLREKFWVVHANAAVRRVLSRCLICRRLQGRPMTQKMADLPVDRLTPDRPPFTFSAVDLFGPLLVKKGRSMVKRYGVLFTCLTTRAVHIEVAHTLSTDSFINALRRFVSRRGQAEEIRSDNGTNLVGAERELREEIDRWNLQQIHESMLQHHVKWKFNPPGASHHGGVWERQIRSVRKILSSLLLSQVVDEEGLTTLLCEVESILNSRPLTPASDDPLDLDPLTPNHLLLLRSGPRLPPGAFSDSDNYTRRRWRQIQHLATEFWRRWSQEYIQTLQHRQKWTKEERNLQVGDVVVIADKNAPRSTWGIGRVTRVLPDAGGAVRAADVQTKSTVLTRPVTKLVLLAEAVN